MAKKLTGKVKQVWESKLKQSPSKNKHISYSQLSSFVTCQKQWYLTYVKNLAPYDPSIHAVFGTAMHETIQSWLEAMYHDKVKTAMNMNLDQLLYDNMIKAYKSQKAQNGHEHFSTTEELTQFWIDGKHILKFLVKKRGGYFSTKNTMLAGIETLLYQELRPGVQFKGFIDLIFYSEVLDEWTLVSSCKSPANSNTGPRSLIRRRSGSILCSRGKRLRPSRLSHASPSTPRLSRASRPARKADAPGSPRRSDRLPR